MAATLGHLRLDEVTASDIEALMRQVTATARTRRTGRQGAATPASTSARPPVLDVVERMIEEGVAARAVRTDIPPALITATSRGPWRPPCAIGPRAGRRRSVAPDAPARLGVQGVEAAP
ncbi:hypothetical protein ACIBSS_27410 [Micromonospora aurantiaca]|uniref:Uncharacterized protein n=1 Tax=Micromonospora aurantiaca (nom. illeg.) TaxID=47850 RepID=A0ABQ6U6K2_9ACTN|nr:hypothetical protein [Micromonospora aurantiaca]KAB1099033.1 hypothetical protein F6X54_32445 [Micromonospora aurantiaca]